MTDKPMITLNECVGKQFAKPPKQMRVPCEVMRCPKCGRMLVAINGETMLGRHSDYCKHCGQKLDWSVYGL